MILMRRPKRMQVYRLIQKPLPSAVGSSYSLSLLCHFHDDHKVALLRLTRHTSAITLRTNIQTYMICQIPTTYHGSIKIKIKIKKYEKQTHSRLDNIAIFVSDQPITNREKKNMPSSMIWLESWTTRVSQDSVSVSCKESLIVVRFDGSVESICIESEMEESLELDGSA